MEGRLSLTKSDHDSPFVNKAPLSHGATATEIPLLNLHTLPTPF